MRRKGFGLPITLISLYLLIGLLAYLLVSCIHNPNFLVSCIHNPIIYETNEGVFDKSNIDTITVSYNSRSVEGFYASLDFELKDGKVDWEIVNPENITVYKGYVIYEEGKTYREMTDSMYSLKGYSCFRNKEEVTGLTDKYGKEVEIPDYSYLQFEMNSLRGIYQLILKPESAEGSYRIDWSNKLPRK